MNERKKFRSEEVIAEQLGDPYLILAYHIIHYALLDCKDWTMHEELRRFAASDWCSILLMDAMTKEEIIARFEREMKLAPEKHIDKAYGFWNKAVRVDNDKLREAREAAGLKKAAVSKILEVPYQRVGYWERQGVQVPKKVLEKLCALYNVSFEDLKENRNAKTN